MSRGFLMTLLAAAFLVAFAAAAEAATNLNSSRSNNYRSEPDCVKAGGTWVPRKDGKNCTLPPTKQPAASGKGQTGGPAGLAVSDEGAGGSKPTKKSNK